MHIPGWVVGLVVVVWLANSPRAQDAIGELLALILIGLLHVLNGALWLIGLPFRGLGYLSRRPGCFYSLGCGLFLCLLGISGKIWGLFSDAEEVLSAGALAIFATGFLVVYRIDRERAPATNNQLGPAQSGPALQSEEQQ